MNVRVPPFSAFLVLVAIAAQSLGQTPKNSSPAIDFNSRIRPLLSDRCFACHGPDAAERQADLRLDDETAAKQYAIVPADAAASLVIERITSADPDSVMPPPEFGKPLTEDEVDLLRRWIDQGAEYAEHWAYVAPVATAAPSIANDDWSRNWIDPYVLARLREHDLAPADDADPVSLVRRLAFDLTGLPPSPELLRSFVAEPSEEQYLAVVDEFLGSTAFGERFATIWLDLVRYADTVGYHGDQDHNIAPYRDWVIRALGQNMPFDQFTREQLAGDLLPEPTLDQRIATGYNRLLQTSHEGGVQPKEYLAIYQADRVRNVSAVWMGATVGCAQCHDHKYDPYSARDFYSLAAFFADIDEAGHFAVGTNSLPTRRPPELAILPDDLQVKKESLVVELQSLRERRRAALSESDAASPVGKGGPRPSDAKELDEQIVALEKRIASIDARANWTMVTVSIEPREVRLLPRGNWLDDSGPLVQPAVPEFLGRPLTTDVRPSRLDLANWLVDVEQGVGGMTARVMANRLWYALFGTGLSPSLDDFGGQGVPPTHPQLLDRLAIEFYQSGWDIKHLLRLIVSSRAYRQSSIATHLSPSQVALARQLFGLQGRYRLPAEMVRDTALELADLLVRDASPATSRPYQPAGYYRHLNFPVREYRADEDADQFRRAVYVHWQRQFLHPMFRAFDAPTREECTAQRPRSNTPLSALVLMNDPSFVEAARGLATRTLAASLRKDASPGDDASPSGDANPSGDAARLRLLFETAVGRSPDRVEQELLEETLLETRQAFSDTGINDTGINDTGINDTGINDTGINDTGINDTGINDTRMNAAQLLEVGIGNSLQRLDDNYAAVEIAAWSEVARLILNLSETMVRP